MGKAVVAITGHSTGIGKACWDLLQHDNIVQGFSRSNGYDIDDTDRIAYEARDATVFINNAWTEHGQIQMFKTMLNLWSNQPSKTIINLGSRSAFLNPDQTRRPDYTKSKKHLLKETRYTSLHTDKKCRVSIVNPGFVDTNMAAHNKGVAKMTPEYFAGVIKWIIEQPLDIEIGEIGIWTNTL